MISKANMGTCVITTLKDHPIILRKFLAGNKAHAMSNSIQVQVNCLRVRVNCSFASVKLHLSCTFSEYFQHFSEYFQQFCYTEKERENSCTNFFNLLLLCHQLELPETVLNRESWQILKPVKWNSDVWSKICHIIVNDQLYSILLLQEQNETRLLLLFQFCFLIIFEDREQILQFLL